MRGAFLLAGLSTLLIALNYAVMASKVDDDGGALAYANRAFGPFTGFMTGWFGWFLGVITIGAEIAAFLTILRQVWSAAAQPAVSATLAGGIIAVLIALNLFGTKLIKLADNLSSLTKIAVIVLFIIVGGWALSRQSIAPLRTGSILTGGFKDTFSTSFYMFTGFSFLPIAAKEMSHPEQNIPRALIVAILAVTLAYVGTQTILILLQGAALSGDAMPVATAFAHSFGTFGKMLIMVGTMISTLGVAIAVSFDTGDELASLAEHRGFLPPFIAWRNKQATPYVATLITLVLAAALVLSGSYLFLVKLIVLSSFVQYVATILALIKLRRDQTLPVGMRLPGGLLIPIGALGIIAFLVMSFDGTSLIMAGSFAVVGGIIYWLNSRHQ